MTKYLLILMFFSTPPYNLSPAEQAQGFKDEAKHIWSFQNTWSSEFPTRDQCRIAGFNMMVEIRPVATMNVRGWCVCIGDTDTACPPVKESSKKESKAASSLRSQLKTL